MKMIRLTVALPILLASCTDIAGSGLNPLWSDIRESVVCMPGGMMWTEHEVGRSRHQEMYSTVLRFKEIPKDQTVPFLLSRIDSTDVTSVHICPFTNATEGELAVYLLEEITGRPWFSAIGLAARPDNGQAELSRALRDHKTRQQLVDFYRMRDPNKAAADDGS